jgi:hypothetical protein
VTGKPITGLGDRWLCPDCGRVIDRPPYRVRVGEKPRWNGEPPTPGYYHAFKCDRPMVRCVVILGGAP